MADIDIRKQGRAGRITLNRPQALNALSWDMCLAIEAALDAWRDDPEVALVLIDGAGERAFCAGGDLQDMYDTARAGNFAHGRRFWADEYRLNAKIADFPKPYVALLHGYTMGGGVGVGCHGSHRIVDETSVVAMPEAGIGLIPDVGGSYLLARAPGQLGAYLGTTAARMGPGDAIFAGFADSFVRREYWLDLVAGLEETGDVGLIGELAERAPQSPLAARRGEIDALFAGSAPEIARALDTEEGAFAAETAAALRRSAPLSVACTLALIAAARAAPSLRPALAREYRFTWRSAADGDFIEGIRAAIIDKDRAPRWHHARLEDVTEAEVAAMLAPLGKNELAI